MRRRRVVVGGETEYDPPQELLLAMASHQTAASKRVRLLH